MTKLNGSLMSLEKKNITGDYTHYAPGKIFASKITLIVIYIVVNNKVNASHERQRTKQRHLITPADNLLRNHFILHIFNSHRKVLIQRYSEQPGRNSKVLWCFVQMHGGRLDRQ